MTTRTLTTSIRQRWIALALIPLITWYGIATLPYLGDFPVMEWAQMRIVEPAYKLAAQGIYGNDLIAGFYRAESHNYDFMPLYPVLVAVSFKLLGPGVWQARLVSLMGGLLAVLLTFQLGRQLYNATLGVIAATVLCVVRLGLPVPGEVERIGINLNASGIPLLDFARLIRYDIWVPVWVLAACCCFCRSYARNSRLGYLGTGLLAGLATLSHVYGAFMLVALSVVLLWSEGGRLLRRAPLYLMGAGWLLALLPWALYVGQDLEAYRGQMLRHAGNFDLLNPAFYLSNLLREPWRYLSWLGGSLRHPILWPRVGLWLLVGGVIVANVFLWDAARRGKRFSDRLLLVALPILALLLALLIGYKRYYYVALLLPFLALQIAFAIVNTWRQAVWRPRLVRAALGLMLVAALWEGGTGVAQSLRNARATTPYFQLTETIAQSIPSGARLLVAEPFWLGLTSYETRSIHLAFLLSDPYFYPYPPSMEQVIEQIDPDYVVTEERLLEIYARDPALSGSNGPTEWRRFDAYLQQYCPIVVADIAAPDYGDVKVYRCEAGAAQNRLVRRWHR